MFTPRVLSAGMFAFVSVLVVAVLTAVPASSELVKQAIDYDHDGMMLRGYLVYDDAQVSQDQPGPGVLVFPEWWGLNDYARHRADQLAMLGYVAFAADMYGFDPEGNAYVTTDGGDAQRWSAPFYAPGSTLFRTRAAAGLRVLAAQPNVNPQHLGAIGYCFGGTAATELAYSGAGLSAVVSFHGSLNPPAQEDLPSIKASILICHGVSDPLFPMQKLLKVVDALEAGDTDYAVYMYGHAAHSFSNPKADGTFHPGVKYNAEADARSWAAMQRWFESAFAE